MPEVRFAIDAPPKERESAPAQVRRQRGQSNFPFGPVGVREQRRQPFRANELEMSNTPRRRENDNKTDA